MLSLDGRRVNDPILYCPRCGALLEAYGATRRCPVGDMELSVRVNEILEADFGTGSTPKTQSIGKTRWGGRWFCPADASPMSEWGGTVGCRQCGRSLSHGTIYQLVEYHVHARRPSEG